jgi:pSer/pThr/pTyr-binding forkhead associated (FHA) protein
MPAKNSEVRSVAILIGMSEEVKGQSFEIDRDIISIGRSADNTIIVENPTVSSHHCHVLRSGDECILRDIGSTNGTRVNARDVKEAKLKPKDIIQVGSVEFVFDSEHAGDYESILAAQVEVAPGPTAAPESFESISPFGARKESGKGFWYFLITVVGILALVAVAILFFKLVTTG